MDGRLRNMASLYLIKGDRMLLLYRQGGSVVNDVWVGSAGGHFESFELNDARACVLRELQEELGITENEIASLHLRYVTLRRTREELRQNYYFFAKLRDGVNDQIVSNEGICKWFAIEDVCSLKMPFTAQFVVEHYLKKGCYTDMVYGGIADGEQVVFIDLPAF